MQKGTCVGGVQISSYKTSCNMYMLYMGGGGGHMYMLCMGGHMYMLYMGGGHISVHDVLWEGSIHIVLISIFMSHL